MKRAVIGIACGLVLVNTLGCVVAINDGDLEKIEPAHWQHVQKENRDKIATLQLSQHYKDLLEKLGTPDFSEQHGDYQILYYRTHGDRGRMKKSDCTPLIFQHGKLIGWGEQALALSKP